MEKVFENLILEKYTTEKQVGETTTTKKVKLIYFTWFIVGANKCYGALKGMN